MDGVARHSLLCYRLRPIPIPRYQVSWNGSETVLSEAVCGDSVPDQALVAVHIHQPGTERNLDTTPHFKKFYSA